MLIEALSAGGLVVVTVVIHAAGFDALLRAIMWSHALDKSGFRRVTRWVIGLACWLILIHFVEISVWGLFYVWQGCMPDYESAFYLSGASYTAADYGDLVLPKPWRLLGAVEAVTGILMYGLSTGLFFAVVSRWMSNFMKWKADRDASPHQPGVMLPPLELSRKETCA
jgi:hypothetical protein